MAVTEFAVLHCSTNDVVGELRQRLQQAQATQEKWHSTHFPGQPSSRLARGDAMFRQNEDPSKILLTVRWDSLAAHGAWIASDENKEILAGLSKLIDLDQTSLFHLGAEIFSNEAPPGTISLLNSPVISVGRMFVDSSMRDAFTVRFNEVRGLLDDFVKPHSVRAGWRADKEDEKEEFVVFCGWESQGRHFEFAETPGFQEYRRILDFVAGADSKHYKRFL